MAEAEANPSLGGYDDDFVSEVEDELQCAMYLQATTERPYFDEMWSQILQRLP